MPFDQRIPRPFLKAAVQTYAPSASGVYGISSASEWLYIGEADDIQAALLAHLRQSDRPEMRLPPKGFVYELCAPALRSARQTRLISEYEPSCNPRRTEQP